MNGIAPVVTRFFRDARRRKVFRTGALYVVGAWLALQVADVTFPGFGIPEAAIQALVWAAVLGLPVALVFGWLFEIGAGGIRRTAHAEAGALDQPQPLGRRDYLILTAFAAIGAVLVFRAVQDIRETPLVDSRTADDALREGVERLENSIAVLPFANISEDPANDYFCDGISEEILNQLHGLGDLKVIGRTSSFAFKGSNYGIARISALLGVRFVLQGSVRKTGQHLRISTQLLDQDGVQVWSESFDRQLKNVFDIQSEIASAVAATVASQVTPMPDTGHQPDIEAYEHYLAGRELLHRRDSTRALAELSEAVEIDPEFAEAHAELAIAEVFNETPGGVDRARRSIERALRLKPRLLRAQAAKGLLLTHGDSPDPAGAERVLREVLAQDPNMSDALNWLTNALTQQGREDETRPILERAALIDPLHPSIALNLADRLLEEGQTERAQRIYERLLEQPTPSPMAYFAVSGIYRWTGRLIELNAAHKSLVLSDPSFGNLFFLMLSYAVLGDWPQAESVNERLMRVTPQGPGRIARRAILPGVRGQTDIAVRRLRDALDELGLTLSDLTSEERIIAGTHFARGGDYAAAIEVLEPVVDIESPGSSVMPGGLSHGGHALAWAYLRTGAAAKAARLLAAEARECSSALAAGRPRESWDLYRCAETELLRGNIEPALAIFEQAIDAGWRDYYLRERDPYWASVAKDRRYRALMEKVKADVDRQRAEVQRIDASDGFLAKLDATIAGSAARGP
jgi:TolB-like protein